MKINKKLKENIILFLILLFIVPNIILGQIPKMEIDEVPILLKDEIAVKRDLNGRYCAAIKIISDLKGIKYQSYNGVVSVDNLPGMDMVYISAVAGSLN